MRPREERVLALARQGQSRFGSFTFGQTRFGRFLFVEVTTSGYADHRAANRRYGALYAIASNNRHYCRSYHAYRICSTVFCILPIMPPAIPEKPRRTAARAGKALSAQLLTIPQVRVARDEIHQRRAVAGSDVVTQEDVDLAARVLVSVRVRPYPQAIVSIAGGSLGTVGPMFDDWFMRWAYRDVDPNSPALDAPTRMSLHVQRLVAQLEAAVRAQIRDAPDPRQALIAAVQLGEQHGLRAQLAAVAAERDRLSEALSAMTYKVSQLESQNAARVTAERISNTELKRATERLQLTFERLREELAQPVPTATAALTRLASEVRQLRTDLERTPRARPGKSVIRKSKEGIRKSAATKSRTSVRPEVRSSRRTERTPRVGPGSRRRARTKS